MVLIFVVVDSIIAQCFCFDNSFCENVPINLFSMVSISVLQTRRDPLGKRVFLVVAAGLSARQVLFQCDATTRNDFGGRLADEPEMPGLVTVAGNVFFALRVT